MMNDGLGNTRYISYSVDAGNLHALSYIYMLYFCFICLFYFSKNESGHFSFPDFASQASYLAALWL